MTYSLEGKLAWITGASTGIGFSIVKELLNQDCRVIATARNIEPLDKLKEQYPKTLSSYQLDVTDQSSLSAFKESLLEMTEFLDLVILNAGQCHYCDVSTYNTEVIEKNFSVNFFGLSNCIELSLPLLRQSKEPFLVGMTSSVAYVALSRAQGYGSSKAAAKYLLEALQVDLHHEKIPVSIIYPGFVKTPLTDKNDFPMPWIMSSEKAAKIIVKGIQNKKLCIAFPWRLVKLFRLLAKLPDSIRIKVLAKMVRES